MLNKRATPENNALLRDPAGLMAQGQRQVAKAVLFPVRFIYTAEVGGLAANPQAARHFLQTRQNTLPGTAQLVQAALEWREQGSVAQARILDLLHAELVRVYLNSLPESAAELRGGLRRWQAALEA